MSRLRFVVPPVVASALALVCASSAPAAFPGANGRLAFISDRDGNFEIYTANADGSDTRRLTNDPATDSSPTWSPDGRHIAFTSYRDGDSDICVMNADGSGLRKVTDSPGDDFGPSWSPDGERIAFYSGPYPETDLFVVNADGTGLARIVHDPSTDRDPAWTRDGTRIAFESARSGSFRLYLVNPDGSNLTELTSGDRGAAWPDWSPDGQEIVFVAGNSIATTHPDGSGFATVVAEGIRPDGGGDQRITPVWSPAGDRIAFSIRTCYIPGCTPWLTTIVNPDGTGETIPQGGLGLAADWQPIVPVTAKNRAQRCKAERERLGDAAFRQRYESDERGSNAFGKCVSRQGDA